MLKDLGRTDSSSVRSQSAFMRRVAEEPDGIGEHNNKVNELSRAGQFSWLEGLPVKQEAAGSSPVAPANSSTRTL